MNKQIESIPYETLKMLEQWDWPGNIRELENFLERSVILTEASVLRVPLAELRPVERESAVHHGTLEALRRIAELKLRVANPRYLERRK